MDSHQTSIEQALKDKFKTSAMVSVKVEASCHDNLGVDIVVVDDAFKDVALLQRHQMVREVIDNLACRDAIHKMNLKTYHLEQAKTKGIEVPKSA